MMMMIMGGVKWHDNDDEYTYAWAKLVSWGKAAAASLHHIER